MHKESMVRMKWFVDNYIKGMDSKKRILDVGSYDVNGSYKHLFDDISNYEYVGLDMVDGPNVDYVPRDPYNWEGLEDDSFDFIISGNAFEHIEYPWLTICEIEKKLKKGGVACIIAPNSIPEHRYPVDCYRYFADGFRALAKWANLTVIQATVGGVPNLNPSAEWYAGGHNDSMMILTKGISEGEVNNFPVLSTEKRYTRLDIVNRKCTFLINWINTENKKEIFKAFLDKNKIRKVYLYGYGKVGKIVYSELSGLSDVDLAIIDKNKECSSGEYVLCTGEKIDEGKDSCLISSLLDDMILLELNSIYPNIRKYNIDEIIDKSINI